MKGLTLVTVLDEFSERREDPIMVWDEGTLQILFPPKLLWSLLALSDMDIPTCSTRINKKLSFLCLSFL